MLRYPKFIFWHSKEKTFNMSKVIKKGDDPMHKLELLKNLHNASRGNLFAIEIPKTTKEDENRIEELAGELETEGKIKLRECVPREYSVYLHGIIKYASE
jgi:hypothetical protein